MQVYNGIRLCTHTRKIISLAFIYLFTVQKVPSLYQQSSARDSWQLMILFFYRHPVNNLYAYVTFSSFFVSFSSHIFCGLARACINLGSFSLFVQHLIFFPITHLFPDEFQPNLVQHFPQVCSTCHTIFSLKKTLECVCVRLLHCSAITWTLGK